MTQNSPRKRYVTVSVLPATHARLIELLRPRETLDKLVLRIIESYGVYLMSRHEEH